MRISCPSAEPVPPLRPVGMGGRETKLRGEHSQQNRQLAKLHQPAVDEPSTDASARRRVAHTGCRTRVRLECGTLQECVLAQVGCGGTAECVRSPKVI